MTFFLGLLKSLDELLYEVISWLLFWPLTLWKTLRYPRTMLAYVKSELQDAPQRQFTDTLQPPLFLVLAVLLVHAIELATVGESEIIARKIGLAGIINDDTNLMLLRLVSFGALPLILAARLVRRQGRRLDRELLRPHFYAQCYAAGAFAFVLGLAAVGLQLSSPAAKICRACSPARSIWMVWLCATRLVSTPFARERSSGLLGRVGRNVRVRCRVVGRGLADALAS